MSTGEAVAHLPAKIENGSTILLLVRHGQTTWNVERRFQGQLDVPLSIVGITQAEELAEWIATQAVQFSAIYSSDLSRAANTARPVARKLGLIPRYSEELRELNAGEWQGLTTAEVEARYQGQLQWWRTHIEQFTLPNGESVLDVQHRVSKYLTGVVQKHVGEAIIVVSHGAALAAYIAQIHGWDLQETWDSRRARMSNTGVTALTIPNVGAPRTFFSNSTDHLQASPDLPSVMDRESAVDKREPHTEYAV